MKSINILGMAFCIFLGTEALRVEKRANPAVLKLGLTKKTPEAHASSSKKRRSSVETPDINYQQQLLYIVELMIGTPPQSTFVQLDTGSSDLIVETSSSDICSTAPPNPCTNFGFCKKLSSSPKGHCLTSDR